jgi:hypothetical protein
MRGGRRSHSGVLACAQPAPVDAANPSSGLPAPNQARYSHVEAPLALDVLREGRSRAFESGSQRQAIAGEQRPRRQLQASHAAPGPSSYHEEGVGRLNQALELALLLLQLRWRVEQIDITVQHLRGGQTGGKTLQYVHPAFLTGPGPPTGRRWGCSSSRPQLAAAVLAPTIPANRA